MSTEICSMPIEECRLFIAALSINAASSKSSYIAVEKGEKYSVYSNSVEKQAFFKTQEIVDAAEECFLLIGSRNKQITERERRALLKHLKIGLQRYKNKVKPHICFSTLCGLLPHRSLCKISCLYSAIKQELKEISCVDLEESSGQGAHALLCQITSFSLKDLWEENQVVSSAKIRKSELAVWRAASAALPWDACYKVFRKLAVLEKEVHKATEKQLFRIRQKKDIVEAKRLIERVKEDLVRVEAQFTQKLEGIRGRWDFYALLFWIELYPSGTTMPLKNNRFFTLSIEDTLFPEAVEVSREIARCMDFSRTLEESFRARIACSHDVKRSDPARFRDLAQGWEEELSNAEALAQGNEKLTSAIALLRKAKEKDAPWLAFSLEQLPSDRNMFEKSVRKMALRVHPDKNRGCQEAATILFSMLQKTSKWILQNNYNQPG